MTDNQNLQYLQYMQNLQNMQSTQNAQGTQNAQSTQNARETQSAQNAQSMQSVQSIQSMQSCELTVAVSPLPAQTVVAMAYIPFQQFDATYSAEKGFDQGTIFPDLDKPFTGKRGVLK